jgi:LCP family protein required for cell wall assembly
VSTPREPGPIDPRQPLPPELDPRRAERGRVGHGRPWQDEAGAGAGSPWAPTPGSGDRYGDLYGWADDRSGTDWAPAGPAGPGGPRPPAPPGRPRRVPAGRTPGQRFLLGIKVLAGILSVSVLAASGYLYFLYRDFNGKVGRVNAIGQSTVADVDGQDENILLVGSDDRSTATPAELRELGTEMDPGKNTDTMILVHVPADGRKATAISFPRDSYVNIPGFGKGKLNAAYADGAYGSGGKADPDRGRRLLVQTISELSGIRIDHYVEVDLLGFYRITKAIGGVEVCLKKPAKDSFSGIDLPAGKQTIQGKQALAFVRQRHGLPNGDLDRIARQQYFLSATFRKMKSAGVIGNPLKLKRLLDAIGTSVRMDSGLDPLQLARQVRGLASGNIEFKTVPNKGPATVDGRSVVLLDTAALPAFFRSVVGGSSGGGKSTPARTVPRGQVSVQVYNGSGRKGLATQTATALRSAGFTVASTGNADRTNYQQTVIRYAPASLAQANTLAAAIPGAQLEERQNSGNAVQLVLGADFAGVRAGGSGTTPTSAAPPAGNSGGNSANTPARTAADTSCIN